MPEITFTPFLKKLHAKLKEQESNGNFLISAVSLGTAVVHSPLISAEQIFPKLRELIASAQSEVLLQFYKIDEDCDGEQDIIEGLQLLAKNAAARNSKVTVRLLVNRKGALGEIFHSKSPDNSFRSWLFAREWVKEVLGLDLDKSEQQQDFLQLDFSNPKKLKKFINLNNELNPELALTAIVEKLQLAQKLVKKFIGIFQYLNFEYAEHTHKAFGSYHSKMAVIDRREAIVMSGDPATGRNDYKDKKDPSKQAWIELGTHVAGESVVKGEGGMVDSFRKCWNSASTQTIVGTAKQVMCDDDFIAAAPKELPIDQMQPVLFMAKKAKGINTSKHQSPHLLAALAAIGEADATIDICLSNLNTTAVIEALVKAVKRGVQVNILLPKFANEKAEAALGGLINGGTNQAAVKKLFAELRKQECEDYEKIDVRWVTDPNKKIVQDGAVHTVHAKMIIVDEKLVMTGSSAFDGQADSNSQEADIMIDSHDAAKKYKECLFAPLFQRGEEIFADKDFAPQIVLPAQELLAEARGLMVDGIQKFEVAHATSKALEAEHLGNALGSIYNTSSDTLWGCNNAAAKLHDLPPRKLKTTAIANTMSDYHQVCNRCYEKVAPTPVGNTVAQVLKSIGEWFVAHLIPNWLVTRLSPSSIVYSAQYHLLSGNVKLLPPALLPVVEPAPAQQHLAAPAA